MVGSAVIHLNLWAGSYGAIPTVGPLFLFQGVAGLVCAAGLVSLRRVLVMTIGAILMVSTAAGLLLSHFYGLFGYHENLAVPYAGMSLVLEFVGTVVLVAGALTCLYGSPRTAGPLPTLHAGTPSPSAQPAVQLVGSTSEKHEA
jgi:hypothetical protein